MCSRKGGGRRCSKSVDNFMALQCAIPGYLAAINYFHKIFGGWELLASHCMVLAVGKGIDRAHGKSDVRPKVRMPLTWDMLAQGMESVTEVGTERSVI